MADQMFAPQLIRATEATVAPVLVLGGAIALYLAETPAPGGETANILTFFASILGASGVVGFAVRQFFIGWNKRADERAARLAAELLEQREEDRAERLKWREDQARIYAMYESQLDRMTRLYEYERDRAEKITHQWVGKQTIVNQPQIEPSTPPGTAPAR